MDNGFFKFLCRNKYATNNLSDQNQIQHFKNQYESSTNHELFKYYPFN